MRRRRWTHGVTDHTPVSRRWYHEKVFFNDCQASNQFTALRRSGLTAATANCATRHWGADPPSPPQPHPHPQETSPRQGPGLPVCTRCLHYGKLSPAATNVTNTKSQHVTNHKTKTNTRRGQLPDRRVHCAHSTRRASRGARSLTTLPPVQTRHVHASGGASDSASQHEGQKHPHEGPEGEALHRHEFFVLAVPFPLPYYLPLRDAGGEGRCLGDACVGGGHTNDRGGLPGGRGLSCNGRGLSCMSGAARARGARGAALSERVQESRNGTLKG